MNILQYYGRCYYCVPSQKAQILQTKNSCIADLYLTSLKDAYMISVSETLYNPVCVCRISLRWNCTSSRSYLISFSDNKCWHQKHWKMTFTLWRLALTQAVQETSISRKRDSLQPESFDTKFLKKEKETLSWAKLYSTKPRAVLDTSRGKGGKCQHHDYYQHKWIRHPKKTHRQSHKDPGPRAQQTYFLTFLQTFNSASILKNLFPQLVLKHIMSTTQGQRPLHNK